MLKLSTHAKNQASVRGFDPLRSLQQVNKIEEVIRKVAQEYNDPHVYVILYKFARELNRAGCRGDNLVACVDLTTQKITTIMLQPTFQVNRNKKNNLPYVEAI